MAINEKIQAKKIRKLQIIWTECLRSKAQSVKNEGMR